MCKIEYSLMCFVYSVVLSFVKFTLNWLCIGLPRLHSRHHTFTPPPHLHPLYETHKSQDPYKTPTTPTNTLVKLLLRDVYETPPRPPTRLLRDPYEIPIYAHPLQNPHKIRVEWARVVVCFPLPGAVASEWPTALAVFDDFGRWALGVRFKV